MKLARHHFSPVAPVAVLVFAVASLSAAPAPQQPVPDELDLKTAIGFALENNFAIRQARERIKQQEGVVIEVSAREIPNVAATGAYQANDKEISQTVNVSPTGVTTASDRAWSISLTASQVIFAGGRVRS